MSSIWSIFSRLLFVFDVRIKNIFHIQIELNMKIFSGALCLFILFASSKSWASDVSDCTSSIAVELAQCLGKKERLVDAQIAEAFEKASKIARERFDLVSADRSLLERSQLNWNDYIDAQCRLIGVLQGMGVYQDVLEIQCRLESKIDRLRFLKNLPVGG